MKENNGTTNRNQYYNKIPIAIAIRPTETATLLRHPDNNSNVDDDDDNNNPNDSSSSSHDIQPLMDNGIVSTNISESSSSSSSSDNDVTTTTTTRVAMRGVSPPSPSSSSSMDVLSIDDAIDGLSCGKFHIGLVIVVGISYFVVSLSIMLLLSSSATQIAQNYHATTSSSSSSRHHLSNPGMTTRDTTEWALFLGMIDGAFGGGRWGDKYGRCAVIRWLLSLMVVSSFGGALLVFWEVETVLLFFSVGELTKFTMGLGMGGISLLSYDLLAEYTPQQQRARNLITMNYFSIIGMIISSAIVAPALTSLATDYYDSVAVIMADDDHDGYYNGDVTTRLVGFYYITCGLLSLGCILSWVCCCCCCCCRIRESPRWLVSCGRIEEALVILRQVAEVNHGNRRRNHNSEEEEEQQVFSDRVRLSDGHRHSRMPSSLSSHWEWKRRDTLLLLLLYFLTAIALGEAHASLTKLHLERYTAHSHNPFITPLAADIIGTTLVLIIVDAERVGRIHCQMAFYSLGVLCALISYLVAGTDDDASTSSSSWEARTALMYAVKVYIVAGLAVLRVSTVEMLPTIGRARGHGMACAMAYTGSLVHSHYANSRSYGTVAPSLTVNIFVLIVIQTLVVSFVSSLPETKGRGMGQGWVVAGGGGVSSMSRRRDDGYAETEMVNLSSQEVNVEYLTNDESLEEILFE